MPRHVLRRSSQHLRGVPKLDLITRLNAVLTRTRIVLVVEVGVVTPKPRGRPRARPSFHGETLNIVAALRKPMLTSTKAPTKPLGAPHVIEAWQGGLDYPTRATFPHVPIRVSPAPTEKKVPMVHAEVLRRVPDTRGVPEDRARDLFRPNPLRIAPSSGVCAVITDDAMSR
jgi:hypothetical protein